jgi:ribonuclease D
MSSLINRKNFFTNDLSVEAFEKLSQENSIAIDTEGLGLEISRDRLCLIQIATCKGAVYLVHFPTQSYHKAENLKKLLSMKNILKLFHFARYDLNMISEYLGVSAENVACTRIMSKIFRTYSDRHGLNTLCRELLNVDLNKNQQSSYWGAETLSDGQLHYAICDVIHLHSLFEKLKTMLERETLEFNRNKSINKYTLAVLAFKMLPSVIIFDRFSFDIGIIQNY